MSIGVIASHGASGGGGSAYDTAVLALSPLWYAKCDETSGTTAADSSGNARNATIQGAVGLGATKVRPGGSTAFDFPGTVSANAYVTKAAWMQVPSFTIAGWVQADTIGTYQCIWSRDVNGAGTRGPSFYIDPAGKLLLFAGTNNLGTAALSTGTNYFVVATFDASTSTVTLYINGSVDATITSASVPNSGNYDIIVGASYAASAILNFPFDGRIDDLAYIGSAITAPQVSALYAAA